MTDHRPAEKRELRPALVLSRVGFPAAKPLASSSENKVLRTSRCLTNTRRSQQRSETCLPLMKQQTVNPRGLNVHSILDIVYFKTVTYTMMLLIGMWINFTKKPMKPIIANPIAVAMAIFWNSGLKTQNSSCSQYPARTGN